MAIDVSGTGLPAISTVAADLRLGIDQPTDCWPTTPRLKSYEAAGFAHVQVRMPPRALLTDPELVKIHATALRDALDLTGLHLILHAPDDLLAGDEVHDRQLAGALDYAAQAGCDLVVYHASRVPLGGSGGSVDGGIVRARLRDEEHSLRRIFPIAERLGVRLACENLAPVYPGVELACHNPATVADLVRRLDSSAIGMCLDLGHAHIAAELADCDLAELIEPVLPQVILFHLHDNFGGRALRQRAGGRDPLRLDLHLAPGAGSVPWESLAPLLAGRPAPLQLEVHPPARPEPGTLAVVVRELLGLTERRPGAGNFWTRG
jgi:sugar phosphate isomerase/epimerase